MGIMNSRVRILVCSLLILGLVSCTSQSSSPRESSPAVEVKQETMEPASLAANPSEEWKKKEWINKVARLLRNGAALSHKDDLAKLMMFSRQEIIEFFMKDPRFSESILDFNLFFFGYKNESLRLYDDRYPDVGGRYRDTIFDAPAAITAAREVAKNGNYLKLLDYRHPQYLNTQDRLFISPDKTKTDQEYREYARNSWLGLVDQLAAIAETGIEANRVELCKLVYPDPKSVVLGPRYFGMPIGVFNMLRNAENSWGSFYLACNFPEIPFALNTLEKIRQLKAMAPEYLKMIDSLHSSVYNPRLVTELKELDFNIFKVQNESVQLSRNLYVNIPNSSTNFNRKRASFILKRYFCDDLTPINVVQPETHGQGRHSSETSCQSCHYKLDPMAGYFRDLGYGGYSWAYTNEIRFDDMVVIPKGPYLEEWKAPAGSGRTWNVGYIRSTQYPEKNVYGDNVEDLFKTIKDAPETKACIVKRATQYLLGEEQILDAGYLEYLTKAFATEAQTNSSQALKGLWTRLLLSKTFEMADPNSNECYDYAPGDHPAGKPPCKVAFIFEKNCTQCHGVSSSLNLSQWIKLPSGEMNFPHKKQNGQYYSQKESLTSILDRLTQTNADLRMPLNKYMTNADREVLVLWAEKMLAGGQ
ncbi:MAG: hypothetical protein AB7F59_06560 [Bdellovibrionales bacterium]